jgi:pimeloyl-ACP methyl ester carboxylesterase
VEVPALFAAGDETLFGVLTRPPTDLDRDSTAVVLVAGGWLTTSADRNRTFVRIARELAADGLVAFRFDYHGIGESTGVHGPYRLREPDVLDLDAALEWLRGQGICRFVLVGVCFGARTALQVAADRPDVEALALVSMPVTDGGPWSFAVAGLAKRLSVGEIARRGLRWSSVRELSDPAMRRVFAKAVRARVSRARRRPKGNPGDGTRQPPQHWPVISATVEQQLLRVRDRVRVFLLYGEGDEEYVGYLEARQRSGSDALTPAPGTFEVVVGPVNVHGFARLSVQDDVVALLREWCAAWRPAVAAETESRQWTSN